MDVDQRVCMRPVVQTYNWTRGSLCIQRTPVNILHVFVDNTSGYASSLLHSTCLAQGSSDPFVSRTTLSREHKPNRQELQPSSILPAYWPTLQVGPFTAERTTYRRVGKHSKKSCTLVRCHQPQAPVMHKSKLLMQVLAQVQDKEPMDRFRFMASDRVGALPNSQECEGQVRS